MKTPVFKTLPSSSNAIEDDKHTIEANLQNPSRENKQSLTEYLEDDGFIYEDNDAAESDSLFKQKIKQQETNEDIVEMDTAREMMTIDRGDKMTSIAVNSIASKDFRSQPVDSPRVITLVYNDLKNTLEGISAIENLKGTPFVSKPTL
jgi:hypothetical protein